MKKEHANTELDVDKIIKKLLVLRKYPEKTVRLDESQIKSLLLIARQVILDQPILLEITAPVCILGDIHGQFTDLLKHFDKLGYPPKQNYLMLGDYVDRGHQSIETVCLILAYKVKYPNNYFVLRGNHESASINRIYGFYDECKRRYNVKLWKCFTDVFNVLPLAAIISESIFCMHGGISPDLESLDQIRKVERPTDVPDAGIVCDLLWSDPDKTVEQWAPNERGVSWLFGKASIEAFLDKFDFGLIVRAHEVVEDGYEFFGDQTLVTVFSAPNYCGEYINSAAAMVINKDLTCWFSVLQAKHIKTVIKS